MAYELTFETEEAETFYMTTEETEEFSITGVITTEAFVFTGEVD